MNVDQIYRLAAFQADEIKQVGTLSPFTTTTELVGWANSGNELLERELRLVNEGWFARTITSATASTKILGIDYAGSSFAFANGSLTYTLPPDFIRVISIRFTTTGRETDRLEYRHYNDPEFQEALRTNDTYQMTRGARFFYSIIGERTLTVAPDPNVTLAVTIDYVSRPRKLVRYSTGTIAVTDATTAVTGVGTAWSSGTPFDPTYADILFGSSGSATLPTPDPTSDYDGSHARVASVTTDTALVLASNKVGTLSAGTGYIISMIPRIPSVYHGALVDFVTARILMKARSEAHKVFLDQFYSEVTRIREEARIRDATNIEQAVPVKSPPVPPVMGMR